MIADLKPHPKMNESGVNSITSLPEHWEIGRLKSVCSMKSGETITSMSIEPAGSYPVYGGNGLRGYTSTYTHDGSFVLIGRQGALCGNVHLAHGKFWASEHAVVATTRRDCLPGWLAAIVSAMNLNQYSMAAAQPGLSVERVLNLRIPVPPAAEQTDIVRFLDRMNRHVQRYMDAKQKRIVLLEEQKQAIIHQGVTGQIDVRTGEPYCDYRNSGAEWLGRMPKHWSTRRTKLLLKEVDVRSITGEETNLSMSQVLGLVPSHYVERTLSAKSYVGAKICETGDLVLNRLKAHLGVFAVAGEDGLVSPDYSVFRNRGGVEMEYVELVFRLSAMRIELRKRTKGIVEGFWRLYSDDLFDIRIPIPPIDEQRRIAAFAKRITKNTVQASTRQRKLAMLANEFRTRLIADVVTGKVNTHEAAARLQDVDREDDEDQQGVSLGEIGPCRILERWATP